MASFRVQWLVYLEAHMVKYTFDFKSSCLSKATLNQIVKAVVLTELGGVTSRYPAVSA